MQNGVTIDTQNRTNKIERAITHNELPNNIQGENIQDPTAQEKEKEDSSDGINNAGEDNAIEGSDNLQTRDREVMKPQQKYRAEKRSHESGLEIRQRMRAEGRPDIRE